MVCRLKDIADALNISVNAVSRALRDKDNISEELRKKVKAKAAELGYVANVSASALRTGQTNTVAIVYDNFFNPYYSIVTGMLQELLFKEGYNVFIYSRGGGRRAYLNGEMVRQMIARGIDGVISFLEPEDDACEIMKNNGKPLIVIGRRVEKDGVHCITTDDVTGGYLATKYLLEKGHRDILMFSARPHIVCAQERLDGYRKAFAEAGLPVKEENILYVGQDGTTADEFVDTAEKRGLSYSAVFCFNDMMALAAMRRLSEYGKKIPEDVSIIGYDYIESHLYLPVGLTTMDVRKGEVAELAVKYIVSVFKGAKPEDCRLSEPALVEGTTVTERR